MHKILLAFSILMTTAGHAQVTPLSSVPQTPDPLAGPNVDTPLVDGPLALPGLADIVPEVTSPKITLLPLDSKQEGDSQYQPEIGQEGKDVIWVPTPDELIQAMLTVASVGPEDYVVDLGSGDGRIAIAAARDFGARAAGIEYNADLVQLARRNARRAGVADRASFRQGDIFKSNFADATVVTMYLLPSLNLRLRDTLYHMKPGTRILSHAFSLGNWAPDETITTQHATGYFWIVPAKVGGRWAFEVAGQRFTAQINQSYQNLAFESGGPFRKGSLKGADITLTRANGDVLKGKVRGDDMSGLGWMATRIR